jgi:bifunctional non-homologous end joining protein LigD
MTKNFIEIQGQRLSLTNLEKILYPAYGFTKAHILDYYRKVAKHIIPHLKDRALTLKRYPDGTDKEYFYEKRCPSHRPAWVKTTDVIQDDGGRRTFCVVNDLESLIWVENLASLELHVPLAKAYSPNTPDSVVFDLDPGDHADILHCARVALILRDLLGELGLSSYVKTSGQKGLHVLIPLNNSETTFQDTKQFSKSTAEVMQTNYPDLVTAKQSKELRKGKVFINWSQNDAKKTMICVYSLRAREKPFVSFPLAWKELEDAERDRDRTKLHILYSDALERVEKAGDLFAEVLGKKQRLPHLKKSSTAETQRTQTE